jgi:hypothetical protein
VIAYQKKMIFDHFNLAWRTVNPIRDHFNLAWRTVNPIRDRFNLVWRTVNPILDHFHVSQPVDPESHGSKTMLLVTAREPNHQ